MNITEVGIILTSRGDDDKLVAYATITLDAAIVIRGIRLVCLPDRFLISFPSRMRRDYCGNCSQKIALSDRWCRWCGARQADGRVAAYLAASGKRSPYEDHAYPVNHAARAEVEAAIVEAYQEAVARSEAEARAAGNLGPGNSDGGPPLAGRVWRISRAAG